MKNTKENVTFRLERNKREELDRIANREERDRSFLINEALDAYLARERWEEEHIREGLRQAEDGEFADAEVEAFYREMLGDR